MPREDSEKICCVCLGSDLKLNNLSMKDENELTLHSKLTICVSKIEWLELYRICEECMELLDISYTFRETCLKSELERQKGLCIKLENQDLIEDKTNKEESNEVDKAALIDESDLFKLEVKKEVDDEVDLTEQPTIDTTDVVKDETTYCDDSCDIEEHHLDPVHLKDKSEDVEYEHEPPKRKRRIFTCDKCGNTYKSRIKLVDHCTKDHGMKSFDVRPFTCDRCPTRFRNSSNLIQHIKCHEGDRSNICTYCGKGFTTKSGLKNHVKQHLNKREFRCDKCGKCFNTRTAIRSHKLIVHTESTSWKYCCEICKKPFPIKSNYDNHMRTHSGDKQFECDLCQRKFATKCVLQRHMRTHSDVRDHKCSNCKKEYKDPRRLKIHMAQDHGIGVEQIKIPPKEKKYSCNLCSKSYYVKNKLTRHLYTHSGEKPYDCPVCGKKLINKYNIKHHLKKLHDMDEAPQENNKMMNTDSVPA